MNNFTDKTFKIVNRKIKLNNYKKKKKQMISTVQYYINRPSLVLTKILTMQI